MKIQKTTLKIIVIVGLVLVVIRVLLPPVALSVLNHVLDEKLGVYQGHVNDLDLNLYRGAYQLQGLEIKKRDSKNPPLLSVKEIDLSVAWRGLLKRNITADVTVDSARIELADSQNKAKKQTGAEEPPENRRKFLDAIVPISIETLKIKNSEVYFTNHDLKSPLMVSIQKIDCEVRDLRSRSQDELSPFQFKALIQKHAPLEAHGKINILSEPPEFDLDIKLEKFNMASVNKLLLVYVPLDITKGELDLYAEAAMKNGNIHGYSKLFLKDADIIAPQQEFVGAKHFFFEIGAAFGNWLLKNKKTNRIAVKVPFNYQNKKLDINASDAFWSTVKNSGDELKPGFDKTVSLKTKIN